MCLVAGTTRKSVYITTCCLPYSLLRPDKKQFQRSILIVHAEISSYILHSIHFVTHSWRFLTMQRKGKEIKSNESFRFLKWRLSGNRAYPGPSRSGKLDLNILSIRKMENFFPCLNVVCYQLSSIQMGHRQDRPTSSCTIGHGNARYSRSELQSPSISCHETDTYPIVLKDNYASKTSVTAIYGLQRVRVWGTPYGQTLQCWERFELHTLCDAYACNEWLWCRDLGVRGQRSLNIYEILYNPSTLHECQR